MTSKDYLSGLMEVGAVSKVALRVTLADGRKVTRTACGPVESETIEAFAASVKLYGAKDKTKRSIDAAKGFSRSATLPAGEKSAALTVALYNGAAVADDK